MNTDLVDLPALAAIIRSRTGMVLKEAQMPALEAAVGRVAPGVGVERVARELSEAGAGPLMSRLIDEVTVQETYFYRELRELEAIDWRGLLAEARATGANTVRVWVAACSTGEEAYSLAMLASEALGTEASAVSILASDISTAALVRAEAGEGYSERSVRNLSLPLRQRYLVEDDDGYRVKDRLKAMIRFRHHNLIVDSTPPLGEIPFDIVACRNVLIYFDQPTADGVVHSLARALRPGGRLVLGAADRLTGSVGDRHISLARPARRRRPRQGHDRSLRRPLGLDPAPEEPAPGPRGPLDDGVEDALLAADAGELDTALEVVARLLAKDPLNADALFVRGLVELEQGESAAAVESLRRCLYIDSSFGLAAFQLGRAYDAEGDGIAARRAYRQALRTLAPEDGRHRAILDQIDLGDVAAAAAKRLQSETERLG